MEPPGGPLTRRFETGRKKEKIMKTTRTRPARAGDIIWTSTVGEVIAEILVDDLTPPNTSGTQMPRIIPLRGRLYIPSDNSLISPEYISQETSVVLGEDLTRRWGSVGGGQRDGYNQRSITLHGDDIPRIRRELMTTLSAAQETVAGVRHAHLRAVEDFCSRQQAALASWPVAELTESE